MVINVVINFSRSIYSVFMTFYLDKPDPRE